MGTAGAKAPRQPPLGFLLHCHVSSSALTPQPLSPGHSLLCVHVAGIRRTLASLSFRRSCQGRLSLEASHCPSRESQKPCVDRLPDWLGGLLCSVDQSERGKCSLLSCRRRLGPHVCLSGFGSGCCPGWAPSMGSGHCTLRKCLSLCPKHPPQQGAHSLGWSEGAPAPTPSLHFSSQPSARLAVGVASVSLPTSVPARMESKGPPAQVTGVGNG